MPDDFIGRPLDLLLGYEPGMPLPLVRKTTERQWHPEDAAPDPREHDPKEGNATNMRNARTRTEDVWVEWRTRHTIAMRRITSERQIKWAKKKRKADDARLLKARVVVKKMTSTGVLDLSDLPSKDMERAEDAIVVLVSIAHDARSNPKDRISAAKAILDFTRAKPAAKAEVTVSNALTWLDQAEDEATRLLETNK